MMASHPDEHLDEFNTDLDIDVESFTKYITPDHMTGVLEEKVRDLEAEVERLRGCLNESLHLQRSILTHWDQSTKKNNDATAAHVIIPTAKATSTPYSPTGKPTFGDTGSLSGAQAGHPDPFLQQHSLELSNTSRMIASALHHAKLQPPMFAGDNGVHPEDWLQAVNTYRSSLNLTDKQIINELPHFLTKEPGKWFKALSSHVVSWSQFCQLFRTVFLPSDNQERILRGILDRIQAPDEPLPTFVTHMLSEFHKLKSPPPEKEQIELICKHSLEKYKVALYGTLVPSAMDLLLRAHELHVVLGPSSYQTPTRFRGNRNNEPRCFKCIKLA